MREKNRKLLEEQDTEIYMATLKERNRIAREIHDNVGHMLCPGNSSDGSTEHRI